MDLKGQFCDTSNTRLNWRISSFFNLETSNSATRFPNGQLNDISAFNMKYTRLNFQYQEKLFAVQICVTKYT